MPAHELEILTRLTREEVAGLVEGLLDGLKDGRFKIQKSGEQMEVDVPRVVDMKIAAKSDEERTEFVIDVSWRTHRAESPDNVPEEPAGSRKRAAKGKTGVGRSRTQ
ncbi:MAG: amphi-Trp domain-containing protein [Desulfovibrio sp.]|jgi:amphi-Trp domain-containing protein|nr:amphi-Trp domain-containing protein [Desulfovibrio sp.]